MAWLFERVIELAAWVALILALVFLASGGYYFFQGVMLWWTGNGAESPPLLVQARESAVWFVLSALGMGALACIDRYVFDLPTDASRT
jgi:hypothetical protein